MYKNIQINQTVTFQDSTFSGCYLKIIDLSIPSFNSGKAEVLYSLYKTKEIAEQHPDWCISVNEIQSIFMPYEIGDVVDYDTISNGIKQVLLYSNPTWSEENIIIE